MKLFFLLTCLLTKILSKCSKDKCSSKATNKLTAKLKALAIKKFYEFWELFKDMAECVDEITSLSKKSQRIIINEFIEE